MKDQLEKSEALVIGPTRASSDVTPAIKQGFNMGKFTEELAFSQQEQQTFKFGDCEIRVVVRDGDPWFVASDVASALCYRNASDAARNLKDHQKGTHIVRTLGGSQKVTIITESGLYKLVLRSRKPEAEEFSDWVTGEVLPSIRKTGSYAKAPVDADQIALARLTLFSYSEPRFGGVLRLWSRRPALLRCALVHRGGGMSEIAEGAVMPITQKSWPKTCATWGNAGIERINSLMQPAAEILASSPGCDWMESGNGK